MRLNSLKKFLTNSERFDPGHPEYRRVFLLNTVLLTFIFFFGLYAILNFFIPEVPVEIPIIELTVSVCACCLLLYFHKSDRINAVSYVTVVLLLVALVVYFEIRQQQSYALYWFAVFPPVAYFLLGRRSGRIFTALFGAYLLWFILSKQETWLPSIFDSKSVGNIVGPTLVLILLISYFELSRKEAVQELQKTNEVLKDSKDELRLILDSAAEGIYGVDREGRCTFCNAGCLELLGYKAEDELLGKDMHLLLKHSKKDGTPLKKSACDIYIAFLSGKKAHREDEVFHKKDGSAINVEYFSYPKYRDGASDGAVVTFFDVTERKKDEEEIKYLSYHDSLTGLYNRSCLQVITKKYDKEEYLPVSVIFGDLNGLKLTNDVFGHAAGDELLIKASEVLKKVCRKKDMIARVGGDEFIILLPNTDLSNAGRVIERIKGELRQEKITAIKCSMALGLDKKDSMDQELELTIKNAENEMYREKSLSRKVFGLETVNYIMASLHARSPREELHSQNISVLCGRMGAALGWPEAAVKRMRDAGYYHDIGKIVLPDALILKTDPLTLHEKTEKQQHAVIGYRILNLFDSTLDLAEAVYYHHENWNGSGYPKGLKGPEIPIQSRIIAIAERYDFLTNSQNVSPYSSEEALAQMRCQSGIKYDPSLVELFIKTSIQTENVS